MKELTSLDDLVIDTRRVNAGTERGHQLLDESLAQCGAGRSIVVDKNGVVLNGNKTLEAARKRGMAVEIVPTNGQELVVVQRTDLDLVTTPEARQLAYYDNRVHQVGMQWSPKAVQDDLLAGVEVNCSFFPNELDQLMDLQPAPTETPEPALPPPPPLNSLPPAVTAPDTMDDDTDDAPNPLKKPSPPRTSSIMYELVFDHVSEQVQWQGFLRQLKDRFPADATPAARFARLLTEMGIT